MLSYRHAFHAGNFADVLKHTVLAQVLKYMQRKDKGYSYVDTHSGAGMYSLQDPYANKTGEYLDGIAKLWQNEDLPEALQDYVEFVKAINENGELTIYPGSPSIARHYMRRQDAAFLYDLHPTDHGLLSELFAKERKVQVFKSDGYQALKAHLPPATRRGVVLIDPPYELKTDYRNAVEAIVKGYKQFNSGTYVLWYPVVQRHFIDSMEQQFVDSGVRNVLQLEFQMNPDSEAFGMTGTGLFVVNPPWTLADEARQYLPYLTEHLTGEKWLVNQLVEE